MILAVLDHLVLLQRAVHQPRHADQADVEKQYVVEHAEPITLPLSTLPGRASPAVAPPQKDKVITHCEDMGDRFAILDGVEDKDPLKPGGPLQNSGRGLLSRTGSARSTGRGS